MVLGNDALIRHNRRSLPAIAQAAIAHDILDAVEVDFTLEVVWLVNQSTNNANYVGNFKNHEHKRDVLDGAPFSSASSVIALRVASQLFQFTGLQQNNDTKRNGPAKSNQDEKAGGSAVAGVYALNIFLASLP